MAKEFLELIGRKPIVEAKKPFHKIAVGGEFRQGKYVQNGIEQYFVFEKISRSKAKVVEVHGYPDRHRNGIHHIDAHSLCFEYVEKE